MCMICSSLRPWNPDCDYDGLTAGDPAGSSAANALVTEGTDAAGGLGTAYTMAVGDTFSGSYGTPNDTDWIRVTLSADNTYDFFLDASEGLDAYMTLRNGSGVILIANDDANGRTLDSAITYTPTMSGIYYLEITQYETVSGNGTPTVGTYQVRSSGQISEGDDAAAGTGTAYGVPIGNTFNGSYGTTTDTDWIRVTLTAGESYRFTLNSAIADTYLLLRNANGTILTEDDDSGVGSNSVITFTASVSGTYYLEASQFGIQLNGSGVTGSYQLVTERVVPPQIWTPQQMVTQLIDTYWEGDTRHFDVSQDRILTVNLTALTPTMLDYARRALQAWTDSTGLVFQEVQSGADIDFTTFADDPGPDAYADSVVSNGIIQSSFVNIDQEWLDTQYTLYVLQTYIHEIGHALGLGHAGNYNGSAVYGLDNDALNDSWQLTVMSYFDQQENTYINDTMAYIATPMIADILAITQLYGAVNNLRTGATTYGENSNAGGSFDRFSPMNSDGPGGDTMAMTIVDHGGIDTLDFRSDSRNQVIDLHAGAVSDVYGHRGTLAIALDTVIENALAGSGNDVVTGNGAANRIEGNLGNDRLVGEGGNDSLYGGDGTDTLNGGDGDDFLFGGSASTDLRDVVYGGAGHDSIDGGYGNDELNGGTGNDTIQGGFGADTMVGNEDNDQLLGAAGSDLMSGNAGNDTLNGGFGHDRLNGGTGADTFFHLGVADHGSDWVQDYSAAEGDILQLGIAGATRSQLQVNYTNTAGAGSAGVAEAFVIYRPTGQILWALVDGAGQDHINVRIGGQVYDLMA